MEANGFLVDKPFSIIEKPIKIGNQVGNSEVLIKTIGCGICNSDIEVFRGIRLQEAESFGHEGYGRIVSVGAKVERFKPGDYVGSFWHPAYATNYIAPEDTCVKLPDEREYWILQPVASVLNALRFVDGKDVIILGSGFMAILFHRLLPDALVIGKHNRRFIADLIPNVEGELGADIVIEASGHRWIQALDYVKTNGTIIFYATPIDGVSKEFFFEASWKGLTLRFPSPRNVEFKGKMEEAVTHIKNGLLAYLVSPYKRDQFKEAFEDASYKTNGYVKGVILNDISVPD